MQGNRPTGLPLSGEQLLDFCRRWKITELALFGSVLRDELKSDSDVDILVTFSSDVRWGLFDHLQMEQELSDSLGRKVDILTRRSVEQSPNWLLRDEILHTAEVVYES